MDIDKKGDADLRRRAEELLNARHPDLPSLGEMGSQRQLHELQVYQIELEMQNEELRHANLEIEQGLKRYTGLFDFAPIGYLTLGCDGAIAAANLHVATLLGVERSRLVGRMFLHRIVPAERPHFSAFLAKVLSSSNKETCEVSLIAEKGHPLVVEVNAIADPSGGKCLLALLEITERKQAEERLKSTSLALQESEERMRWALQSANGGAWELDLATGTVWWSEAMYQIWGVPPGTPVHLENYLALIDPADRERVLREIEKAIAERFEYVTEFRIHHPTAGVLWISSHGRLLLDTRGTPVRLTGLSFDITERKHAELGLLESETFVTAVVDSLTTSLAVLDESGVITMVNESWRQFKRENIQPGQVTTDLGIPYLDVVRKSISEGEGEEREMAQVALVGISSVLTGRLRQFSMEYPCHSPDRKRWFGMNVSVLKGAKGGAVVAHTDITERKQLEEAIRAKEENFRTMANSAPVLIWIAGTDERCTWFNNQWLEFTGRTLEEELAEGWVEGIHPEDRLGCLETFHTAFERRSSFSREYRLRRANGHYYWVITHGVPTYEETRFTGYIGSCIDISNLKQAEEALKSSEELYRQLFEMESDAVLMVDMERERFMDGNTAALRMYGYSREELLTLGPLDLSSEPAKTRFTLAQRKTFVLMRQHRKKDGTVFPVEIGGSFFEYQGREVHVVVIRDISERIRAEKALIELNEKLRALSDHLREVQEEERKSIARDFHDDIGQNITVLKLDLDWIGSRIPREARGLKERVAEMGVSVDQLRAKVQGIVAKLRPPLLDSMGLCAAIDWHVDEFSKRSGIECHVMLNEDVEPLDQHTATEVMRIVQEGLTNVARHARATEVSISLCKKAGNMILELSDNGVGIAKERLASPTTYGLMGMQERARSCRGDLQIEETPGGGATLHLTIPLTEGDGA